MDIRKLAGVANPGDGLPPDAPRGRQAEAIMWGELLQEFRTYIQTSTAGAARLAGRMVNQVLEVRSHVFTEDSSVERSFHVAAGAVFVDNYSAHDVIVAAGGRSAGDVPPPPGVGVYRVKAGQARTINLAAHQFTIYGTLTDEIAWQVFAAGGIIPAANYSIAGGGA